MIPDEIKDKVAEFISSGKLYINYESSFKQGIEFGYSLSQQTITSLSDKLREQGEEIERLKGLITKAWYYTPPMWGTNREAFWQKFKTENNL